MILNYVSIQFFIEVPVTDQIQKKKEEKFLPIYKCLLAQQCTKLKFLEIILLSKVRYVGMHYQHWMFLLYGSFTLDPPLVVLPIHGPSLA